MKIDGFDIDTVEGSTAYLKSKGVDVDAFVNKGIEQLKRNKALDLYRVSQQREQLINFLAWHDSENLGCLPDGVEGRVDEYLKLINCG